MSKKKNNTNNTAAQTTENEVVQEEVVETPTETTDQPVDQTPAEPAADETQAPTETPADDTPVDSDVTNEEVVQVPVTDETPADDTPVDSGATKVTEQSVDQASDEPAADEVPADVTVTTDQPVDQTPTDETPVPTETPVDAAEVTVQSVDQVPAADEAPVETTEQKPVVPETSKDKNPKYGPGEQTPAKDKEEKPADSTPTPPTTGEKLEQNPVDKEVMSKELMTSYDVRFAFSQNSKKYAVARKMTLYNMIEIFVKNRTAFVGVASQAAFDHIKDYVLHNPIIYAYQEFTLEARTQFIGRLEINTDYVLEHLVK